MFRSPFVVFHEEFEKKKEFTLFVSKAIEKELREYFIEEDGYDQIEAGNDDVLDYCRITEEELSLVDKDDILDLFPEEMNIFLPDFYLTMYSVEKEIGLKEAQACFTERAGMFLAKKFIQLVKLIKAEESFTPDLIMEAMICRIAEEAWLNDECEFEGKEELVESLVSYYSHGAPDDDEYDDDTMAMIEGAAHNLNTMLMAEGEHEIDWLLWDYDYSYLLEGDYKMFSTLLAFDESYSAHYIRSMYISVDENVPYAVEKALEYKRLIEPRRFEIKKKFSKSLFSHIDVCYGGMAEEG